MNTGKGWLRYFRNIALLILFLLPEGRVLSQDMHFVNFTGTGPLLSPAEAGNGIGRYRVSSGHRSQWASVTAPFLSNHISFDTYFSPGRNRNSRIGLGLSLQQDQAGDADFGTTGGMLCISFSFPVSKTERLMIGAGGGMMQRKFDRSKLYFDEQFNGLTYDPDISPLDFIREDAVTYVDLSAGITWSLTRKSFDYRRAGFAVHHPNQPELSFLSDNQILLDPRWTAYFAASWELDGSWAIRPETRIMKQGPYYEYLFGAWLTRIMENAFPDQISVEAGLFTRAGDALILAIGGSMHAWKAALSYDINYSGLHPASSYRGGYELNLVYQLGRIAPDLKRKPGCFIL